MTGLGRAQRSEHGRPCFDEPRGSSPHTGYELVDLAFTGRDGALRATPAHRIMTETRGWVPAGDLRAGERVKTRTGTAEISSVSLVLGTPSSVFNLEIGGSHQYFVHDLEVLAHNTYGLVRGAENIGRFGSLNEARAAARRMAGLGDDTVKYVSEVGPMRGQVVGSASRDGLRGWRIDYDPTKGFHVNWWDKTGGSARSTWTYGANIIEGGTQGDFLNFLQHLQ